MTRTASKRIPARNGVAILVIDVGGTSIKVMASSRRDAVKLPSGPHLTPRRMVRAVTKAVAGWDYSAISIGYPGPVANDRALVEPHNLGRGWVSFDFAQAFSRPVKLINDAAMQALGAYKGGHMLFLGLGTGLGSTMIIDGTIVPMELAHLPYKKGKTYEQMLGKAALERLGKKRWRREVVKVTAILRAALCAHEVVLGGGNAKLLHEPPEGTRVVDNSSAFEGGFRMWTGSAGSAGSSGSRTRG